MRLLLLASLCAALACSSSAPAASPAAPASAASEAGALETGGPFPGRTMTLLDGADVPVPDPARYVVLELIRSADW